MDTRYWGPSGWKLLHLIASQDRRSSPAFWRVLPFVLPCKFCRTSLTTYYKELPIPSTSNHTEMQEWLWAIHNKVNEKLRKQGQTVDADPPFESVEALYKQQLEQPCSKINFPGWEFLFSIADNHPDSTPTAPIPGYSPEKIKYRMKLVDKNEWNLLSPEERKAKLRAFWTSLPSTLPFLEWRALWRKYAGPIDQATESRASALRWLWKIRCGMESELQQLTDTTFHGLCRTLQTKRSGCSTSRTARTCRSVTRKKKRPS